MLKRYIVQLQIVGKAAGSLNLLPYPVYEVKFHLREHNSQRESGETATGAEVHDTASRRKLYVTGYGQRMENVSHLNVVNIAA